MSQTLFISDLHLDRERPEIIALFTAFLREQAADAESLYILGDLFESWVGDDDPAPGLETVITDLGDLAASGVAVYFMHGNRDFLIGEDFAARTNCTLLPEAQVIELGGESVLIMHGDTLCTDDVPYQQFRAQVRNPAWQTMFLGKSLEERKMMARAVRERSQKETSTKAEEIMDVNQQSVLEAMREHAVHRLIHGHTHRPNTHHFEIDGQTATRIVLGDWYEQGSVLRYDTSGFQLEAI